MKQNIPNVFRFMALPNLVSYLSLVFALCSIYFASLGNLHYMAACWLLSGIADCFDGIFARQFKRTELEKQFGKELDTLTDLIAFGLAPVACLLLAGSRHDLFLYLAGGLYIFAAVHRLAYFNITVNPQDKVFYGLPTTECAALLALLLLFPHAASYAAPVLILLAIGMLLPVKVREPKTGLFILLIICYLGLLAAHLWLGCQLS